LGCQECDGGDGLADPPVVNQLATRLLAAAKKGVRCATDKRALFVGGCEYLVAVRARH
jgi:hypothetical protein